MVYKLFGKYADNKCFKFNGIHDTVQDTLIKLIIVISLI